MLRWLDTKSIEAEMANEELREFNKLKAQKMERELEDAGKTVVKVKDFREGK